jgi:pyruvate dehydrogenase E2 component (dihydrolipoamide acetyltransferase)
MPTEIVMPRMGWDMKVGSVAEWVKQEGEQVKAGEVICLISGDKATTELEAPESGRLYLPADAPPPGAEVPVGTLLAYLLGPDESAPTRAATREPRLVATPRARRAAAAMGVDWRTVAGSGRGGRILERDIQRASPMVPSGPPVVLSVEPAPLEGIRRVTAERVELSARIVAAVTLTTEVDATPLVRLREQAMADEAAVPSITDLLVKIAALALSEHPSLNASLTDTGIVEHPEIHVAVAVDTERGLVAPVVRDANKRSIRDISQETRRLIEAARTGRLAPRDTSGATFTITNLGMYEVDAFTPIVNLPQCAILGVGRIVARPVVIDETTEKIEVRRMLALSLTFDHRLVDGAPAARFLQRIKHLIERPTLWLFS